MPRPAAMATPRLTPVAAADTDAVDPSTLPLLKLTFDDLKFDVQPDSKFEDSMLTDTIRGYLGRRSASAGFITPAASSRRKASRGSR